MKEPVLFIKHWPVGFPTKTVNEKPRPINPPSVFHGVPLSQIPTPQPKPRTTTKARYDSRTRIEDEIDKFLAGDKIDWKTICSLTSHINRFQIPMTLNFKFKLLEWKFYLFAVFSKKNGKKIVKIHLDMLIFRSTITPGHGFFFKVHNNPISNQNP